MPRVSPCSFYLCRLLLHASVSSCWILSSAFHRPHRGVHNLHKTLSWMPVQLGYRCSADIKWQSYSFASKALSNVERCSSKIEREASAISWGYHHFRMYLLGSHFKVKTGPQVPVAHIQRAYFSCFSKNWQLESEIAVIWLRSAVLKR